MTIACLLLNDPRYVNTGYLRRCEIMLRHYASQARTIAIFPGQGQPQKIEKRITALPLRRRMLNPINPLYLWQLRQQLIKHDARAIVCEGYQTLGAGIFLHLFTGRPLIYDAHNFESRHILRISPLRWPIAFSFELIASVIAKLVITTTSADAMAFQRIFPWLTGRTTVAENAVDTNHFRPAGKTIKGRVLFSGAMNYPPNRLALPHLRRLADEMKKSGVGHLCLAGPGTETLEEYFSALDNVSLLGEVKDIVQEIRSSSLVVAPLTVGGGSRLKIIEALACGVPVLASPQAAAGLGIGAAVELCPLREFPQRTLRLLRDQKRLRAMGQRGIGLIRARYSWSAQQRRVSQALRKML